MTLVELSKILQKDLVLRYPGTANTVHEWIAEFDKGWIKEPGVIGSASGYGKTPEEALTDYVKQIKGKTLVFDPADTEKRLEFGVPITIRAF